MQNVYIELMPSKKKRCLLGLSTLVEWKSSFMGIKWQIYSIALTPHMYRMFCEKHAKKKAQKKLNVLKQDILRFCVMNE